MKKIRTILSAIIFLLSFSDIGAQNVRYNDFFDDATLRIDYLRIGNRTHDTVQILSCEKIVGWAGSTTQLLDPFDNGAFRVTIIDSATGKPLFSRGYNTLFDEYRDTPEGDSIVARFEEVLRLPWPTRTAHILFEERDAKNQMLVQDTFTFNPKKVMDMLRLRSVVKTGPQPLRLLYNGDPHKKIDIVIIPEGYGPADTAKMRRDLKTFCDYLLAQEPFHSRRKDFNVWGIPLTGKASGITNPNKGVFVESLVGASFNTFGSDRYLMTERLFMVHNAIGWTPCDHIIIMANTDKYGGGGIYNFYAMSSLNSMAQMILPHELGHSIGGLADEYVDPELSYSDIYPLHLEPTEPNITTLVHFDWKWADMLPKGFAIPTPANDKSRPSEGCGPLGVYEGGGYRPTDIFRPTMHCMMRDYAPFCPVCTKRMNEIFDLYTK